jgi:hypothetical protein
MVRLPKAVSNTTGFCRQRVTGGPTSRWSWAPCSPDKNGEAHNMRHVASLIALSFLLAALAHADIIVGTNNTNANVFPFGDTYLGEYQQVYASTAFPSTETITGIKFASAPVFAGNTHSVTVTISLSTTSATVASMSTNYSANKGADFAQVFSGPITYLSLGNNTFDLSFPTLPFSYNPALGNLLMDVVVSSNSGQMVAFDANLDTVTSRVFNLSGNGAPSFDKGHGLVTNFVTAVPEPSGVLLFGSAVALLGMSMRRRLVH